MPAQYAHYRFGKLALPGLSADLRLSVLRLRSVYDLGLQGPDPLFYHSYTSQTRISEFGFKFHAQSGREFFSRCCAHLRREPSETGRVYLYGLLAHFCLDSHCHPFVDSQDVVSHFSLETEFDRYLLARDGYDLSRRSSPVPIALSRRDAPVIAGLYSGIDPKELRHCVRSMAFAQRMLSLPSAPGRKLVARVLRNSHYRDMQLTEREDQRCAHLNGALLERFDWALASYPACLDQLNGHLTQGLPLGPQFSVNFG